MDIRAIANIENNHKRRTGKHLVGSRVQIAVELGEVRGTLKQINYTDGTLALSNIKGRRGEVMFIDIPAIIAFACEKGREGV